jgi:methylmalonyl-CoA mutase C-terminal domain/subunit
MGKEKIIRVMIAKPGLDGHDRGALFIARALKEAGMEVIYTGIHHTPGMIVETAVQEDVDVIGVSILSGAHMTVFEKLFRLLGEKGVGDIQVIAGGIIPPEDVVPLKEMGVKKVFTPGTSTADVVAWIRQNV